MDLSPPSSPDEPATRVSGGRWPLEGALHRSFPRERWRQASSGPGPIAGRRHAAAHRRVRPAGRDAAIGPQPEGGGAPPIGINADQ